jgi:hypothetical protein
MIRSLPVLHLVLALASTATAALPDGDSAPLPAPGTPLPPAARVEALYGAGESFLLGLPEGTRVTIHRASGTRFELVYADGKFTTELPPSGLPPGADTLTTPLGFRLGPAEYPGSSLKIAAPNGRDTTIIRNNEAVAAIESDGNLWDDPRRAFPLRLPDGTRIDMLGAEPLWEALTLTGERFRFDSAEGTWTRLASLPSPPLVPDTTAYYVAGDGDDWRLPYPEDHCVFGWSWFPYGFTVEQILEEVRRGFRWTDVRLLFESVAVMLPAEEPAAYLLGRRLSLGAGDQVTFSLPGEEDRVVYLMPGPTDPDFLLPQIRNFDEVIRPGLSDRGS